LPENITNGIESRNPNQANPCTISFPNVSFNEQLKSDSSIETEQEDILFNPLTQAPENHETSSNEDVSINDLEYVPNFDEVWSILVRKLKFYKSRDLYVLPVVLSKDNNLDSNAFTNEFIDTSFLSTPKPFLLNKKILPKQEESNGDIARGLFYGKEIFFKPSRYTIL